MAEPVTESAISDELRAELGVEGPSVTSEVTSTGCLMFARAVGHTDLIFFDRDVARTRGYRDIVAPPGYLGTIVYRPGASASDPAAPPRDPRIPYRRALHGGLSVEYLEPICAGDILTSRTKVSDYHERVASVGPMLIVRRETTYRHEDGGVVARVSSSVIHY